MLCKYTGFDCCHGGALFGNQYFPQKFTTKGGNNGNQTAVAVDTEIGTMGRKTGPQFCSDGGRKFRTDGCCTNEDRFGVINCCQLRKNSGVIVGVIFLLFFL